MDPIDFDAYLDQQLAKHLDDSHHPKCFQNPDGDNWDVEKDCNCEKLEAGDRDDLADRLYDEFRDRSLGA